MDDEGSFIQTRQSYFDFEESDQNTVQHTRPACFFPSKVPKIRPSKEDPIPEKGSISTATHTVLKDIKTKIPQMVSCPSCTALLESTNCSSTRRVSGISITRLEEIHIDVKSILRRIMGSI